MSKCYSEHDCADERRHNGAGSYSSYMYIQKDSFAASCLPNVFRAGLSSCRADSRLFHAADFISCLFDRTIFNAVELVQAHKYIYLSGIGQKQHIIASCLIYAHS